MQQVVKTISLFFLVLMLGFGCAPDPQQIKWQPGKQTLQVPNTQTHEEEVKGPYSAYAEWAIPDENLLYDGEDPEFVGMHERIDCISMWSANTGGGDLLSSLIVNDKLRSILFLNKYSKPYLASLEYDLVTHADKDVYAVSVCAIEDEVDAVIAYLLPRGEELMYTPEQYKMHRLKTGEDYVERGEWALIVRHPEGIATLFDVQTYNKTATGGEVSPCDMSVKENTLTIDCFITLVRGDNVIGASSNYEKTHFNLLTGEKISSEEYVK